MLPEYLFDFVSVDCSGEGAHEESAALVIFRGWFADVEFVGTFVILHLFLSGFFGLEFDVAVISLFVVLHYQTHPNYLLRVD
jgi:hypothetical protein